MTTPNRYSLSDAEMLEIAEKIKQGKDARHTVSLGWEETFKTLLAQDGMDFEKKWKTLNVAMYAIPSDQWKEIMDRIRTHCIYIGCDPLATSNAVVDWTDYGPSQY